MQRFDRSAAVAGSRMVPLRRRAGLLLLALVTAVAAPLAGVAAGQDSSRLAGWTRLDWEGRKYLVGSAHAALERWPGDATQRALLRITTRAGVFGGGSERFTWVEGAADRSWRSLALVPRRKARVVAATAGRCVAVTRFDPLPRDPAAPVASWTARPPARHLASDSQTPLLDPHRLLAEIGPLLATGTTKVLLAGKDGVTPLTLTRGAERREAWSARDLASSRAERFETTLVEVRLAPRSRDEEGLFALKGPVSLWIDRASGVPVEIEGEHEDAGRVKLRLTAFRTDAAARPTIDWPDTAAADALCVAPAR